MMLDRSSKLPYYCQIMDYIKQQITDGCLVSGEPIPSMVELGKQFRVNRHTVRQAVDELCRTGVLFKSKGRGVYVGKNGCEAMAFPLSSNHSFSNTIRLAGKTPGVKLLEAELINTVPPEVREALQLTPSGQVYMLYLLRIVDGQPFLVVRSYLPAQRFPGFLDHTKGLSSLSAIFAEQYGISMRRAGSTFSAVFPTIEEAELLDVSEKAPVLLIESLMVSGEGEPVLFNKTTYRSDLAKVTIAWQQN